MNERQEFTVTEQHVKLLKRAYVSWEDCEFGAPSIDCKRPYGNSDVIGDMIEILGIEDAIDPEGDRNGALERDLKALHLETKTALQIALNTGSLKPGSYTSPKYESNWTEVPA